MNTAVKLATAVIAAPAAALFLGAGTAAATGFSVDINGDGKSLDVGTGATTSQTGNAKNNPSLAVSIFDRASTDASGNANGNVLVAIDGRSAVGGNANGNAIVTVAGQTELGGNSNGNHVLNIAGDVKGTGQGNDPGVVNVSICGTSITAQGSLKINPIKGGPC